MPFTNQTPNYALPQYIATDHPTYLGDANDAYLKIDTRMKANQSAAAENKNDITLLSARVLANEGNIDNRYTKAQADARFMSNPNILDNAEFLINQRGSSTYSGADISCCDRWRLHGSFNVAAKTLTYQAQNAIAVGGISMCYIAQRTTEAPIGTELTMSATIGGVKYSQTFTVTSANVVYPVGSYYFFVGNNGSTTVFGLGIGNGAIVIDHVKVELGTVATPYVREKHSVDLATCQRYYLKGVGRRSAGTIAGGEFSTYVPTPVTMRATPTITVLTYDNVVANGSFYALSGEPRAVAVRPNGVELNMSITGTLTNHVGIAYGLFLEFSAEL